MSTAAYGSDSFQPPGERRIGCHADQVLVSDAQLTQARRAVERGAPVSSCLIGTDGGDLPGQAAGAARMDGDEWSVFIAIASVRSGADVGSADGAGAPAAAAATLVTCAGDAVAFALADGAAHAVHGHDEVSSVDQWMKPVTSQETRPSMVKRNAV
jgi:hypothetical protein